jgi:hypothetical protein
MIIAGIVNGSWKRAYPIIAAKTADRNFSPMIRERVE